MMTSLVTSQTILETSQTDIYNALKEQGNKQLIAKLDNLLDKTTETNEILARINKKEPVTPDELKQVYAYIGDTKEVLEATGQQTEVSLAGMANYLSSMVKETSLNKEEQKVLYKQFQDFLKENKSIIKTQFKDTTEVKKFTRMNLDKTELTTRRINTINKLLTEMGKKGTNKEVTVRLDTLNENFNKFTEEQKEYYEEQERQSFSDKVKSGLQKVASLAAGGVLAGGLTALIAGLTNNETLAVRAGMILEALKDIGATLFSMFLFIRSGKLLGGIGKALGLGWIGKSIGGFGKLLGKGLGTILGKTGSVLGKATTTLGKTSSTLGKTTGLLGKLAGVLGKAGGLFGGLLGGAGKVLGGVGRVAGKAFLPVTAGFAALDAYKGVKELTGKESSTVDKAKAGVSGAVSGLTFGLINKEKVYKTLGGKIPQEYQAQQTQSTVSPKQIALYLKSKGVSDDKITGILTNIQAESNFNPAAIGDNGTSGGLFQHHASRFEKMKNFVGDDWQKDWKGQIDYALTEPEMKAYLKNEYQSPFDASMAFTHLFEKPANTGFQAYARANYAGRYNVAELTKSEVTKPEIAKPEIAKTALPETAPLTPVDLQNRMQKAEIVSQQAQVSTYEIAGNIMNNNINKTTAQEKQNLAMTRVQQAPGQKELSLDDTGLVLIQSLLTS